MIFFGKTGGFFLRTGGVVFLFAALFSRSVSAETIAYDTGWVGTEDSVLTCADGKFGPRPYTSDDCAPGNLINNYCGWTHNQAKAYVNLDVSLDPAYFPDGVANNCVLMVRGYYDNHDQDERLKVTINGTSEIIPDRGGGTPNSCGGTPFVSTLSKRFTVYNGQNLIRFEHPSFCDENAEFTGFNSVNFEIVGNENCDGTARWGSPTRDMLRLQCYVDSVCGNGATEAGEQCDDGNTVSGDGCSATCQLESPPPGGGGGSGGGGAPPGTCGDGTVDPGEHCDDGNTNDNDECNSYCYKTYDSPIACPYTAGPGDVLLDISGDLRMYSPLSWGSVAGSYNVNIPAGKYDLYLAVSDSYIGRDTDTPQAYEQMFVQIFNSTVIQPSNIIATSNPSVDLPDSVRSAEWYGLVDQGLVIPQDAKAVLFKHYGYENYEDVTTTSDGIFAICALFKNTAGLCGNGQLDPGEQCDDGNSIDNDECSNSCLKTPDVSGTCPFSAGADDILLNFNDKLYSDPTFQSVGESVVRDIPAGTYRVSLAAKDEYPSRSSTPAQPGERVFLKFYNSSAIQFESLITVSSPTPDLADSVTAAQFAGVVDNSLTISQDIKSVLVKHYLYPDSSSPNGIRPICALLEPIPSTYCGDGTVQFPNANNQYETCDDGNTVSGDGCSAICQKEIAVCRNGIVETWNGEQCDDNNDIDTDACDNACQLTFCGDGEIQSPNGYGQFEQCDRGDTVSGDGCSATCQVESPPGVGICGPAATRSACDTPSEGLCVLGTPGVVSYNGALRRWEWNCAAQNCSSPRRCDYLETNP